tara:strand:+ start:152 stop:910 length:759 start_codon:yes stop_codon:yes gene_type:complete
MSQFVETNLKAFTAGAAIDQYLRVKVSSGVLQVATAADQALGTVEVESFASGDIVPVRLYSAVGSRKMVASVAITAGNLVYSAAGGKVAATGTVVEGIALETSTADGDIIEVMSVAGGGLSGSQTTAQVLRSRVTTANVNAGATLLPAVPGFKYRIQDMTMISIGGAAATATTIDILATQSTSSVKLLAVAVAALTQSAVVRAGAANATVLADGASFVANDTNTAVTIGKTGSNLATATHIDVLITYVLEAA